MLEDKLLQQILEESSYIEKGILEKAAKIATEQGSTLSEVLIEQDLITKDILGQAIAEYYKIPYSDLNSNVPPKKQVLTIPEEVAARLRIVFFKNENSFLTLTTDRPKAEGLKEEIARLFPKNKVKITYSLPEDIDDVLTLYRKKLYERFKVIIDAGERIAPLMLDEIFSDAILYNTSDIHFEPRIEDVSIRFRVDGVLQEVAKIPKEYYDNVINRIKVQSRLRIDEHFAAQDGSMRYSNKDLTFDIRTSIVPTVEGEKIVLRILASYVKKFDFEDLGMSPELSDLVHAYSTVPFGMILTTGPTGSGKSTTLYSIIKGINRPEVNITTIEDPVEYRVEGVNQIQVNTATNLTFAKGLRSIVRQDPDIILVGEIRDAETAEIAVNAALTGHLLFSTFHSNDSATSIPRLLDMGIEPFLLSSTLQLVLAQRLVRLICTECRYSQQVSRVDVKKILPGVESYFEGNKITLYNGKGCSNCNDTGFKGRIGIFEFIEITPEIREIIMNNPSSDVVWKQAQKQGSVSLFEDGIDKVKQGLTTIDELMRVASISDEKKTKTKK